MMQAMKSICVVLVLAVLGACTTGRDLDKPPAPLGDFMLGHSIVVAPNLTKGPLSRDATQEEWIAAMDKAFEDRFRRYDGERLYHFGISVEGYVLARVGVPLVLQPKSAVIFRITVWDDAAQSKMTLEPKEVTVLEALTAETAAGSGLTQTREEQLEALSILAAKQVEDWLVEQNTEADWFNGFVPPAEGRLGAQSDQDAAEAALLETTEAADAGDLAPEADPLAETGTETEIETESEIDAEDTEETPQDQPLVVEPEVAVTDPVVVQ